MVDYNLGIAHLSPQLWGITLHKLLQIEPSLKLKKYSLEMVPTLDMHNSNQL